MHASRATWRPRVEKPQHPHANSRHEKAQVGVSYGSIYAGIDYINCVRGWYWRGKTCSFEPEAQGATWCALPAAYTWGDVWLEAPRWTYQAWMLYTFWNMCYIVAMEYSMWMLFHCWFILERIRVSYRDCSTRITCICALSSVQHQFM